MDEQIQGEEVSPIERKIICHLFATAANGGWTLKYVDDGEDHIKVSSAWNAVDILDGLAEYADVFFVKNGNEHGVRLIFGNDIDVISDWTYQYGDTDGFNKLMDCVLEWINECECEPPKVSFEEIAKMVLHQRASDWQTMSVTEITAGNPNVACYISALETRIDRITKLFS